jgi:hypothetical protein
LGAKKAQTHAKRARELAVKEKRERKRAKKAEAAAQRAAGIMPQDEDGELYDEMSATTPEGAEPPDDQS